MIIRCLASGIFLSIAVSAFAATLELPFLKVGPTTYSNVTVIGANATDLYFNHEHGIGNAKLKYLSPDLQKRFNYDPVKAAEAERKRAEAESLYANAVASNVAARMQQVRAAKAAENEPRTNLADSISDKSLLGKTAPALAVDAWNGDQPEFEGKYVLMTFWEPWSSACARVLPGLNALQKQFTDKLVVVGISTNTGPKLAETEAAKLAFPSATDSKGKMSAAAGITSIPSVLLIDPSGVVRYQGHPAALTDKYLKDLFSASK